MTKQQADAEKRETPKTEENEGSMFQSIRDICESLAVALFLAFLFKTFEAEAFVIPTGSMAPTLKGRHKDTTCVECGYQFQTSASEEVDSATNQRRNLNVVAGTCPQCWRTQFFAEGSPSYTGDRILVSKITFDHRELERFDVSVFRTPVAPKINYIKRIVGLPNERVRIQYGDLFVQKVAPSTFSSSSQDSSPHSGLGMAPDADLGTVDFSTSETRENVVFSDEDGAFEIARKDYKHLRCVMQTVNDADSVSPTLEKLRWPSTWKSFSSSDGAAWQVFTENKGRAFVFKDGVSPQDAPGELALASEPDVSPVTDDDVRFAWLRYRRVVPSSRDWSYLANGALPPEVKDSGVVPNNPRLVDDFSSYNAGLSNDRVETVAIGGARVVRRKPEGLGFNWVGDLGVECRLELGAVDSGEGCVVFDLVKGGIVFRCVLAPKQGKIALDIPQIDAFQTATTKFQFPKKKSFKFAFYNVDEEMRVAIDGCEIEFPHFGGRYDHLTTPSSDGEPAPLPRNRDPNARDLSPIAIGARGVSARVENLKVLRDVYYIALGRGMEEWDSSTYDDFGTQVCDRLAKTSARIYDELEAARFMSSPSRWEGYGATKSSVLVLGSDQYLALGDNSACSSDSRLWDGTHCIDRKYLIGKAFYVYWPHGEPLPLIKAPYWPNFKSMRRID